MALEIDARDVVKLILQFCHENGLTRTATTLQDETAVSMNAVTSREVLAADVLAGRWDAVLGAVSTLTLPKRLVMDIYEHVFIEMLELRQSETARLMLRTAEPLAGAMRTDAESRFDRLERMLTADSFDPADAYPGSAPRDKRRQLLADALVAEVTVVPPSRLLTIVAQALKWQQHVGALPNDRRIDLLRGTSAQSLTLDEAPPASAAATVKFAKGSAPCAAVFSPDGLHLATGSTDGFIELWDFVTGHLNRALEYQAAERLMLHETPVQALAFSRDSELLASGDRAGGVKVWTVRTGVPLRKFPTAHTAAVLSVAMSRDGTQVLSASADESVRVHGLHSGRLLKEFRGHGAFVAAAVFSDDESLALSGGADGYLRVWRMRSAELVAAISFAQLLGADAPRPATGADGQPASIVHETAICAVIPMPGASDAFLLVARSRFLLIVSSRGAVLARLEAPKPGLEFTAATFSPRGGWVFALGDDAMLYAFEAAADGWVLRQMVQVAERTLTGVVAHPHRNLVATYGADDRALRTWEP